MSINQRCNNVLFQLTKEEVSRSRETGGSSSWGDEETITTSVRESVTGTGAAALPRTAPKETGRSGALVEVKIN